MRQPGNPKLTFALEMKAAGAQPEEMLGSGGASSRMLSGHKLIYKEPDLSAGSEFPSPPKQDHAKCPFTCFSSPSFLLFSPLGALLFL